MKNLNDIIKDWVMNEPEKPEKIDIKTAEIYISYGAGQLPKGTTPEDMMQIWNARVDLLDD